MIPLNKKYIRIKSFWNLTLVWLKKNFPNQITITSTQGRFNNTSVEDIQDRSLCIWHHCPTPAAFNLWGKKVGQNIYAKISPNWLCRHPKTDWGNFKWSQPTCDNKWQSGAQFLRIIEEINDPFLQANTQEHTITHCHGHRINTC